MRYVTFSKALQVFPLASHWHLWYELVDVNAHFKCETIRTLDCWNQSEPKNTKYKKKITKIMTENPFKRSICRRMHSAHTKWFCLRLKYSVCIAKFSNSLQWNQFILSFFSLWNVDSITIIHADETSVLSVNYLFQRIWISFSDCAFKIPWIKNGIYCVWFSADDEF